MLPDLPQEGVPFRHSFRRPHQVTKVYAMIRPAPDAQRRLPPNVSLRRQAAHVEPLEGRRLLSAAVTEAADAPSRGYGVPASRPGPAAGSVTVQAAGTISGTVYHDADADGTLDPGEA